MCKRKDRRPREARRSTDDAKQLIGNIGKVEPGGPAVEVEKAIAKMRARQVVGSTDGAFAQEFLK